MSSIRNERGARKSKDNPSEKSTWQKPTKVSNAYGGTATNTYETIHIPVANGLRSCASNTPLLKYLLAYYFILEI